MFIHNMVKKIKEFLKSDLDEINSLPVDAFKSLFELYSISDYIPYSSYDETNGVYHNNDGTIGITFEISPPTVSYSGVALAINDIMQKMPEGIYLQCIMYGSNNITSFVDTFEQEHKARSKKNGKDSKLLDETVDLFSDFLKSKMKESCTSSMHTMIKNTRVFMSIVTKSKEVDQDDFFVFSQDLDNLLISNSFYPIKLDDVSLFKLCYEILNPSVDYSSYPEFDDKVYLNKQMVNSNSSLFVDPNDNYFRVDDNLTWINMTPQSLSNQFHIWEFGQKLGDYLSGALDTNQFHDRFIINLTVCKKDKKKARSTSNNHSIIASQNWGTIFRRFAAVREESIDIIDRIDEKKEDLYEFDMDVLVSGKDYKTASLNAQTIETYWNKGNGGQSKIKLARTKGIHHLAFLSALPMAMSTEYFENFGGKFRTLFSNQISHFFPLEVDYRGVGTNLPIFTRRGILSFIDLFESPTNYNAAVFATSGAGKSVFLNMLGFMSYARGDKLFILDYDNSFLGLLNAIDGQYLDLNPEKNAISFNPFWTLKGETIPKEDLEYLSTFIYLLGSSKNQVRAEEDEKLIKTELQNILVNKYDELGNKLEITHVRDAIRKEFGDKDSRFMDFARQLGAYCNGGSYAEWFSGPCQFTMEKDALAVEFKNIEPYPDLRDPIIMLLLYHIGNEVYSTDVNKPRIQIVLDEAHKFLDDNPRMEDFVKQAYRRARKFNGSVIIATQGFSDIYNDKDGLSKTGSVIVNNSATKIFLSQTQEATNLLIKSGVFELSDTDKRIIKGMKTVSGEYSEMFVIFPTKISMLFRLIMPPFFYYLTTTKPSDKKLINETMKNYNVDYVGAIKHIINQEEEEKR